MKTYCLFLFSLMVMACGENGLCKDEELAFGKQSYQSQKLKISGYYYHNRNSSDGIRADIFVLYQNGAFRNIGSHDSATMDEYIATFSTQADANAKYEWGLFMIQDSSIRISQWELKNHCSYAMSLREGNILNDSTFKITSIITTGTKNPTTYSLSDTFHFRAFSPKPDSTNDFIE